MEKVFEDTEDVIEVFFDYLQSKETTKNTLVAYKHDIGLFCEFIYSKKILSVKDARSLEVLDFVRKMQQEGASVSKINRTLSALKTFYKYLTDNKLIFQNPTKGLKNLKGEHSLPKYLNEYQIDMFLAEPNPDTIKGIRDRAILELMYATGIRVSELINLKVSDVNFDFGCIYCTSPKGKERVIPIYDYAKDCIKNYIDKRSLISGAEACDALFLNLNGKPLSRQGIWKMIKYYDKKSGVYAEITPQSIRHTIAVHMLKNGYDIKNIKEMMGHSELSYTRIYEKALEDQINKEYRAAHPRAKYKKE